MRTYSYIGLWSNRRYNSSPRKVVDARPLPVSNSLSVLSRMAQGQSGFLIPCLHPAGSQSLRLWRCAWTKHSVRPGLQKRPAPRLMATSMFSTKLDGEMLCKNVPCIHPLGFYLRRRLIVRIDEDAGRVCDLKRTNRPGAAGIKLVSGGSLSSPHPLVICARNPIG